MNVACCLVSVLAEARSPTATLIAILGAGVLVFVVAYRSFAKTPLFNSGRSRAIAASCVAAMSVIGLLRMAPRSAETAAVVGATQPARPVLDFVLLPYTALALTLIFMVLVFIWLRFARCLMGRLSLTRHRAGLRADFDGTNEKLMKQSARGGGGQSRKEKGGGRASGERGTSNSKDFGDRINPHGRI